MANNPVSIVRKVTVVGHRPSTLTYIRNLVSGYQRSSDGPSTAVYTEVGNRLNWTTLTRGHDYICSRESRGKSWTGGNPSNGLFLDFYQLNDLLTQRKLIVSNSVYVILCDLHDVVNEGLNPSDENNSVNEVCKWLTAIHELAPNSLVLIIGISETDEESV
jgi:hypothetical protein